MFIFKAENNNLYYFNGSGYVKLNNEAYLDASRFSKGLMTSEHITKLEDSYDKVIETASIDNGYLTLRRRDGSALIENIQVGNSIVPLLSPSDLLLTVKTPITAVEGKYMSASTATYNKTHLETFYNKGALARYSNSSTSQLENTSQYVGVESSARKFFVFHRFRLNSGNFSSSTKYYLNVNWRFNHAEVKYGILIKKGNSFYHYYEEGSYMNTVQNEDRLYDLSGISGNEIIVYCYASRWWSFYTNVFLLEHGNLQQPNKVGTYSEFETLKNILPQGSSYFITDTNNNKGVLATKVGSVWKDMIGNEITNINYRTVL